MLNIILNDKTKNILEKNNIIFEVANIHQLDEIYELYNSRTDWFKENNIKQWSRYIIRHKNEFPIAIENKNFYVLKKDNEIVAGFELSNNPGYFTKFNDYNDSLYLNKIVSKVGYKGIGKYIFMICRDIAENNNKNYLSLDCVRWNNKLNRIYEEHGFKVVGYGKSDYEYCLRKCNVLQI